MAGGGVTLTKGVAAAFTFTSNVAADDTVIIGEHTYIFKASPSAAFEVDVGTDLETSIDNLTSAINLDGTVGAYGASHVLQSPYFVATDSTTVTTLTARYGGEWVNGIRLGATSPGANDIAVTGAVTVFASVTTATLGAGDVSAWGAVIETAGMQPNSQILSHLHELTEAVD